MTCNETIAESLEIKVARCHANLVSYKVTWQWFEVMLQVPHPLNVSGWEDKHETLMIFMNIFVGQPLAPSHYGFW